MRTLRQLFGWLLLGVTLTLGAGQCLAADEPTVESDQAVAPVASSEVEELEAPEEGLPAPIDGSSRDVLGSPFGLDGDGLIPQSAGSCGPCNCNEDDDCEAICGKPASCVPRICPCATCTGSCYC